MSIDNTRASREGHEYHEAWTARRALELLLPKDGLIAIAVEGLSTDDDGDGVTAAAVEIADLSIYFGDEPTFAACDRLEVLQFKYSLARAAAAFVAADARKTLIKFAEADRGFVAAHGTEAVEAKVSYGLVVNRPAGAAFVAALAAAAEGRAAPDAEAAAQLAQIEAATGLSDEALQRFCRRLSIQAAAETPASIRHGASRTIADWSAARDALSKLRLANLCRLVRDKAGAPGADDNLIRVVEVLGALDVAHEDDLLPSETNFADVGEIVTRSQLGETVAAIRTTAKPLLIRAGGGVGKTVFMQSLAASFGQDDHVVLFDCFGGGAYRSPEDERHLPRRGLMHIVNELATRGLCDLILPGSDDAARLLTTARARFAQAVDTLRLRAPDAVLVVLIDAADNAAQQAQDRHEPCFATMMLEAFAMKPEEGLRIVASCRPSREALTRGRADVALMDLEPFTDAEARAFLSARVPDLDAAEAATALARSLRNPRVLAHLVDDWDRRVRSPEAMTPIDVEELIEARVERALNAAGLAGGDPQVLAQFLAGLTLLPTPIPVDPFAEALAIRPDQIADFCADLAPLLDQGIRGVTFRDEPTEHHIRTRFAATPEAVTKVVERLERAQGASLYAARALPRVLQIAGDAERAIALALSDVMPAALDSDVGKRALRTARVSAAIAMAAKRVNVNHLVTLLVEMSGLAAVNSRGDDYLSAHPDLVFLSGDDESLRRLFERRGGWPGKRHARVSIVRSLYGDRDEALDHARRAYEWIDHYFDLDERDRWNSRDQPEAADFAAAPLFLAIHGKAENCLKDLNRWREEFGFKVAQRLVQYLAAYPGGRDVLARLIKTEVPCFAFAAAVLADGPLLTDDESERLLAILANGVAELKPAEAPRDHDRSRALGEALVVAAARAVVLKRNDDVRAILAAVGPASFSIYDLERDRLSPAHAPFLIVPIVRAWAGGRAVSLRDLLPREVIAHIGETDPADGKALIAAIDAATAAFDASSEGEKRERYTRDEAERFKRNGIGAVERLHGLASTLLAPIVDPALTDDAAIGRLIEIWREKRRNQERYRDSPPTDRLADAICRTITFFIMTVRTGFSASSAMDAIGVGEADEGARWFSADEVAVLARCPVSHEAAGRLAARIATDIETEDFPTSRGNGFARLADAIVPASREEAAAYFRRGLRELDTIGAGDYQLIQELMWLASKLKGAVLDGPQAQRFMNLCAINVGDEPSRFPWGAFASAAAHALGARALAQLSRWDMREEASFGDTLAPCIAAFAETGYFSPAQALALLMLDEPSENWAWRLSYLLGVLLERAPSGERESIYLEAMRQMRLCEPDGVSPLSLEAIEPVAAKYSELAHLLPDLAAERARERGHSDEYNARSNYRAHNETEAAEAAERERQTAANTAALLKVAAETDPGSAEAIDAAFETAETMKAVFGMHDIFVTALREATPYDKRAKHVLALASARSLPLFTRLNALEACIKAWVADTLAVEVARPGLAEVVVDNAGAGFVSNQYGFGSYIHQLSRISGESAARIAMRLVAFASDHGAPFNASTWLEMATLVAAEADAEPLRQALTRLLDSEAAKLADARFDGAHRAAYDVNATVSEVVAALIWQRLGSPDASQRWRAAHSVRLVVRYELDGTLTALAARFEDGGLGPFGDAKIKIHLHNARLWLLIGLARAGREHPMALSGLQSWLESIVADAGAHHVVMRATAGEALDSLYAAMGGKEADRAQLSAISATPIPRGERSRDHHWREGRDRSQFRAEDFHFGYDFDKYDITGVGDLFALPHAEITERLVTKVNALDADVEGMDDVGGRGAGADLYSRRGNGSVAVYGEQLTWHALIAVASDLSQTHAVVEDAREESSDPWTAWLSDKRITRTDGLWLADGTDAFPAFARASVLRREGDNLAVPKDEWAIAQRVGVTAKALPDWLLVDANWDSSDSVDVSVRSALLPARRAFDVAKRLASGPPHKLWAPVVKGSDEERDYNDDTPLKPWIVMTDIDARLDEHDPFGARGANERPRWTRDIATQFGATGLDPFGRTWVDTAGATIARARAWGRRFGQGRYERNETGESMECRSDRVIAFLRATGQALVMIIKLDYRPRQDSRERDERPDHAAAVLLISGAGSVKAFRGRPVREPRRRARLGRKARRQRRVDMAARAEWLAKYVATQEELDALDDEAAPEAAVAETET